MNAQDGEPFFGEELDEIPLTTKDSSTPIVPPRLSESFLDRVVSSAGGERLDSDDTSPNRLRTADYRLGDLVLELKDIQTESMDIKTKQEKVARLFSSKLRPDCSVIVDPKILSEEERRDYLNVIGRPIRKRLEDAGEQVRLTMDRFSTPTIKGGAILLNTGYGSVSHDLFCQIAEDYVSRSSTLSIVICISAWTVTNGFDTEIHFMFHPAECDNLKVGRLQSAFWKEINTMMAEWSQTGLEEPSFPAKPLRPIVFNVDDGVYTFPAPKVPSSVK